MKYLKKYKLDNLKTFESYGSDDLIDYVDFHLIEDIFDKNYHMDFDEAIYIHPALIWDNFDDERFVTEFERDYLENQSLEDVNPDDIKEYVLDNLTDSKKSKIREMYLEKNEHEDEEDLYDSDDYENMLDEFDDDEIVEVAEEDENSYDIAQTLLSGSFAGQTAKDIISEFYGIDPEFYTKNRDSYSYRDTYDDNFQQLKKIVVNYIDKQGVEKDWKNGESDDYKKEFTVDYIEESPEIQKNIIANNPEKALDLFDLIEGNDDKHIGDDYNFQKAYIEQYEKDNPDDHDEGEIVQNAIFNLYEEFGLNPEIKKEYSDELILITMSNYNI